MPQIRKFTSRPTRRRPLPRARLIVAQLGSTGYNLYDQYKQQQYQNTLRQDAQNPAKVTALAQQYTQPLTAGLTAAVNNSTQAQLAQAGLSESPQIAQTVESQAIAPYVQQNQKQGINLALHGARARRRGDSSRVAATELSLGLGKGVLAIRWVRLRHQPSYLRAIDAIGNRRAVDLRFQ